MADQQAGDLQFNRAEPLQGQGGLTCAACRRSIEDTYFEVNGQVVCGACRNVMADQWQRGGSAGRFGKALALGLLAAIACSIVWYIVLVTTDSEFGILAIVVGFVVGKAVNKGSNGRGGWRYQALAIFLTYTAIVSSYVPLVVQAAREQATEVAEQPAATDSVASPQAATVTADDPAAKPGAGAILFGIVVIVGFLYAAPFLAGIQNAIGLLIIGIAVYEAWKFNKKTELKITGPYQVSARAAPA
ncbi:MAG TPA: hypothetical protein VGQ06_05600 [Gemmatimonadales bacterium]|nr:hypothetical protein [Gemmatimonadales bacterium]